MSSSNNTHQWPAAPGKAFATWTFALKRIATTMQKERESLVIMVQIRLFIFWSEVIGSEEEIHNQQSID
jgi:hypothetical protein